MALTSWADVAVEVSDNPWSGMTATAEEVVEERVDVAEVGSWASPRFGRYVELQGVRRWRPWTAVEWTEWKNREGGGGGGGGDGGSGGTGGGGGSGGGGPRLSARLEELEKRVSKLDQPDEVGYDLKGEIRFVWELNIALEKRVHAAEEEAVKLKAELQERAAVAEEVTELKAEMAQLKELLKVRSGWVRATACGLPE
jgi:hypothetical protein